MKRIVLSSLIIFSVTVVLSQSSFYYYKGTRVPLNENPLVRYVCLDRQLSEKEVAFITRQLENFSWRVDKYDSTFGKYFVNTNDLNDFLSIVSQYSSKVILHTPNYATIDTDSFYPVRQVLVKNSSGISVDYLQKTTASLDVKSVPAGVYLLRVRDTEGKEYMQKIVKR